MQPIIFKFPAVNKDYVVIIHPSKPDLGECYANQKKCTRKVSVQEQFIFNYTARTFYKAPSSEQRPFRARRKQQFRSNVIVPLLAALVKTSFAFPLEFYLYRNSVFSKRNDRKTDITVS